MRGCIPRLLLLLLFAVVAVARPSIENNSDEDRSEIDNSVAKSRRHKSVRYASQISKKMDLK